MLKKMAIALLFLVGLLSLNTSADAPPASLHIVVSGDSIAYQKFSRQLLSAIDNRYTSRKTILKNHSDFKISHTDLYIAIGTAATEKLFKLQPKKPILSIFVTIDAWEKLAKQHYGSVQKAAQHNAQAIVINQPTYRYTALCQLLLPELRSIGTAVGPGNWDLLEQYQKNNAHRKPSLTFARLQPNTNPLALIDKVLSRSDVFLALPDQAIYTQSTAKWALYLAYRQHKPVVGFSEKYLSAGAVASLYSSPTDIAKQAIETISQILAGHTTKQGYSYPSYYTVGRNQRMADSLGLEFPDNLIKQLRNTDKKHDTKGATSDDR